MIEILQGAARYVQGPGEEAFRRAQNAMLGGFVTLATVGMAAAMIVRGRRQLRRSGSS